MCSSLCACRNIYRYDLLIKFFAQSPSDDDIATPAPTWHLITPAFSHLSLQYSQSFFCFPCYFYPAPPLLQVRDKYFCCCHGNSETIFVTYKFLIRKSITHSLLYLHPHPTTHIHTPNGDDSICSGSAKPARMKFDLDLFGLEMTADRRLPAGSWSEGRYLPEERQEILQDHERALLEEPSDFDKTKAYFVFN